MTAAGNVISQEALPPARPASHITVSYAGFWRRWFALMLDFLLLSWVSYLATLLARDWGVEAYVAGLTDAALAYVYFTATTRYGGSVGKRMLGLRVVRDEGEAVGWIHSFVREGPAKVISAVPLFLGYFWMLGTAKRQCWHDKLVGTVVVREHIPRPAPEWADAPPWAVQKQ